MPIKKPKRDSQLGNTMLEYGLAAVLVMALVLPGLYSVSSQFGDWAKSLRSEMVHHRKVANAAHERNQPVRIEAPTGIASPVPSHDLEPGETYTVLLDNGTIYTYKAPEPVIEVVGSDIDRNKNIGSPPGGYSQPSFGNAPPPAQPATTREFNTLQRP
jgi:hypothetical protein